MTPTKDPMILVRYQDEDETYKYFWASLNGISPSFDSAAEAETWLINNEENDDE